MPFLLVLRLCCTPQKNGGYCFVKVLTAKPMRASVPPFFQKSFLILSGLHPPVYTSAIPPTKDSRDCFGALATHQCTSVGCAAFYFPCSVCLLCVQQCFFPVCYVVCVLPVCRTLWVLGACCVCLLCAVCCFWLLLCITVSRSPVPALP